ncbi:MAG: CoA pyrophosphatase [Saprospiraceae bacterium]
MQDFKVQLQDALSKPLPGASAQYMMAHVGRERAPIPPAHARQAAVMALFFPRENDWHLAFIQRKNDNPNDKHGGQISFPGGKKDPTDPDLSYTALRETEEEIGISMQDIHLAGELTELYIPVSNFLVKPFVGMLQHTPVFSLQEQEVASLLQVPFSVFLDSSTRQWTDLPIAQHIVLKNVPHFRVGDHIIWGATAMMLNELLAVLKD